MQEALPFYVNYSGLRLDRKIVQGLKWILLVVWTPIRLALDLIFTAPPGQEYIEESRLKAMRLVGHF